MTDDKPGPLTAEQLKQIKDRLFVRAWHERTLVDTRLVFDHITALQEELATSESRIDHLHIGFTQQLERANKAEAELAQLRAGRVLTDIGASVKVGSDGRWLNLQGIGKHAALNLESLGINSVHGPIVRMAINGFLMNLGERLTQSTATTEEGNKK